MASGPGRPAPGPPRLADSLARHRWIAAAGMTGTIAAVAGAGVALAFHGSSRPPKECGLVPCAAALPASVQSSGTGPASGPGSASAPATALPTVTQRASAPSSAGSSPPAPVPEVAAPLPAQPSTGLVHARPVSTRAGRPVSANRAIGVGYTITADSHHGIHGEIVIANNGSAGVSGWRVTIVLPGDTHYQVLDAGGSSAGDTLVMEAPAAGQRLAEGSTGWLNGGWLNGGRLNGGRQNGGWPGGRGGGRAGQHHGWAGGR